MEGAKRNPRKRSRQTKRGSGEKSQPIKTDKVKFFLSLILITASTFLASSVASQKQDTVKSPLYKDSVAVIDLKRKVRAKDVENKEKADSLKSAFVESGKEIKEQIGTIKAVNAETYRNLKQAAAKKEAPIREPKTDLDTTTYDSNSVPAKPQPDSTYEEYEHHITPTVEPRKKRKWFWPFKKN